MAIVKCIYTGSVADYVSFINANSPSWVTGSEGVINIGDIITITCDGSNDTAVISYNEVDTSTSYKFRVSRGTLAYNDNFFYLQTRSAYGTGNENRICVLVEIFKDMTISGFLSSTTSSDLTYQPINNFNLLDLDTSIVYKHGNVLNYSGGLGIIDFATDRLFSDSKITSIADPNFITCTTVESDVKYTFNGKNYFSVGPHTLIPMDNNEV